MRDYPTIRALRRGEVVDLEGLRFRMDVDDHGVERPVQAGDLYIAERNTGPKLLTADRINEELHCVHPTTLDYPFDTIECVKVVEAE
jgi:hypothetical protein